MLAELNNKEYYALKNGGDCMASNDYNLITSGEKLKLNSCSIRNKKKLKPGIYTQDGIVKNLKNTQSAGGIYGAEIHFVNQNPSVLECGNWAHLRLYKRHDGKGNGNLIDGTKIIKPDIGGGCGNNLYNTWVQYEFKINNL